jgi:hypothetical protein
MLDCGMIQDNGRESITPVELVRLHKAILQYCHCLLSHPAVLDEVCAAHRMLRDDALVQRLTRVRRDVSCYVGAEFTSTPSRKM